MDKSAKAEASATGSYRPGVRRYLIMCVALILAALMAKPAMAAPEDEVRVTFERFVAAQNAHDIKAVETLLLSSPNFLWITRGAPIWGHEAALKRFAALYEGTWRLEPDSGLKVMRSAKGPHRFTCRSFSRLARPANRRSPRAS
jgi:hypothetical protein